MYNHKNIAAMVSSIGLVIFLFDLVKRPNITDTLLILLSVVFIVGTGGKSALPLIVPATIIGMTFRYLYPRINGVKVMLFALLASLFIVFLAGLIYQDEVITFLENPLSFTGRVAFGRWC